MAPLTADHGPQAADQLPMQESQSRLLPGNPAPQQPQQQQPSIPISPALHALIQQRVASARQLLRMGTESNNVQEAETILLKACELLESWAVDFEEHQLRHYYNVQQMQQMHHQRQQLPHQLLAANAMPSEDDNPFCTLLAQARHRYAQVCVLRGNLEMACRLFLQVLLHDPDTLSPSALAMAWYDVGLIYTRYGKLEHAMAALKKSLVVLHSNASTDETMNFFIQQAMKQVLAYRHQEDTTTALQQQQQQQSSCFPLQQQQQQQQQQQLQQVPWSVQFTMTTYNYDDDDEEDDTHNNLQLMNDDDDDEYHHQHEQQTAAARQQILEEAKRLIDPSVQHAGAA
eukprot:CAMPEP_0119561002 /NCGR_PEP_ID=MMETSP1352-20130426/16398_1 /TAXON_ID=265584 /ORGANISM="Stauroneis constricta, Strain CCMP1120" /LENGTH=342 /DNA_ID=CAMNT_0007609099 /DNA_START=317 /DNA_END=1345 /DNA_ORIENTATION=-